MKRLQAKKFTVLSFEKLADFVNQNRIPKEDILTITTDGTFYTLFFYI